MFLHIDIFAPFYSNWAFLLQALLTHFFRGLCMPFTHTPIESTRDSVSCPRTQVTRDSTTLLTLPPEPSQLPYKQLKDRLIDLCVPVSGLCWLLFPFKYMTLEWKIRVCTLSPYQMNYYSLIIFWYTSKIIDVLSLPICRKHCSSSNALKGY